MITDSLGHNLRLSPATAEEIAQRAIQDAANAAGQASVALTEIQALQPRVQTSENKISQLLVVVEEKADRVSVSSALAQVYTKDETDTRIQSVIGTAPKALDTLQEIAEHLQNDENVVAALTNTVSSKANALDVNAALLLKADKTTTDALATSVAAKENTIVPGNISQYFRGDKTWRDFATDVRSVILNGLSSVNNTAVVATDSVLVALGKLQAQINGFLDSISNAIVAERTAAVNLLNKTLINPTIKNYSEFQYEANVTGTVTIDLNNGTFQKLMLTGNTVITLPPSVSGKSYTLVIGYTGSFVPTFAGGTTLKWSNQLAPPAKSTAGYYDIFVFSCDGAVTFGRSGGSNF